MADYAALPLCAHLQLQKIQDRNILFMSRNVYLQREYFGKSHFTCHFKSPKIHVARACHCIEGSRCMKGSSFTCRCLGMLTNLERAVPSNWVSIVDQAVLTVSIIFAYIAVVVPQKKTFPTSGDSTMDQNLDSSSSTHYGRTIEFKTNDVWSEVNRKLIDGLNANEHDASLCDKTVECEPRISKRPLNLFAVDDGPRLRLLWFTFQRLQKEVSDISQSNEYVSGDAWLVVASEVMTGLIPPVCIKWLEEELTLKIQEPDMNLVARVLGELRGDARILQNISRLGKAELYADLLFFLRFGSLRTGCFFDKKFLTQHGVDILEDLVIFLADGIASVYLELISIDSDMSSEINGLGLTLCSLSTRSLQRLRNEVALHQWLMQYFDSVVAMYEDHFELNVLCRQQLQNLNKSQSEKIFWWKKLVFRNSATVSSLHYVQISPFLLPVKRTKELRALTGWRYYFSLFLEFADITMPLARAVFSKVSSAVSFFLVSMIGRSLGLIFSGIRQSLGWR